MTLRARLFGLFPMLWLAGSGACVLYLASAPGVVSVLALLAVLYLVPVATYRLHDASGRWSRGPRASTRRAMRRGGEDTSAS
jgi:hypothetical protein